jgi:hypothetical protein
MKDTHHPFLRLLLSQVLLNCLTRQDDQGEEESEEAVAVSVLMLLVV